MPQIITLSTDFGLRDNYVASVKATIFKIIPQALVVDISHQIRREDIADASQIIGEVFLQFPEKTIHLLGLEIGDNNLSHIIVSYRNHILIGPDNGIFSLMFDVLEAKAYEIGKQYFENTNFVLKDIYVPIAKAILENHAVSEMGQEYKKFKQFNLPLPYLVENVVRGLVVYVDSYGNLITNISYKYFEKNIKHKKYRITTTYEMYSVNKVILNYQKVEPSEMLVTFSSSGYLEIAVKNGSASDLLNMTINTPFEIEFI